MNENERGEGRGAKMTFGGKKIVPDRGKCIVELQGRFRVQKDLPGKQIGRLRGQQSCSSQA